MCTLRELTLHDVMKSSRLPLDEGGNCATVTLPQLTTIILVESLSFTLFILKYIDAPQVRCISCEYNDDLQLLTSPSSFTEIKLVEQFSENFIASSTASCAIRSSSDYGEYLATIDLRSSVESHQHGLSWLMIRVKLASYDDSTRMAVLGAHLSGRLGVPNLYVRIPALYLVSTWIEMLSTLSNATLGCPGLLRLELE
jgi:hypothetical protein